MSLPSPGAKRRGFFCAERGCVESDEITRSKGTRPRVILRTHPRSSKGFLVTAGGVSGYAGSVGG